MLLILSSNQDFTADFLITELIKRQLPYFRINAEDLVDASYNFFLSETELQQEVSLLPKTLDLSKVTAVWYRRALHPSFIETLSYGEKVFVAGEIRHLATGMMLNPEVLWVNPISKVTDAEYKIYQLRTAKDIGFKLPRTIVSRDKKVLLDFIESCESGGICKPIYHGLHLDGNNRYSIYTRRVDRTSFEVEGIEICPVLLQEEIPRTADVRVTFIGDDYFAADIVGDNSLIDWRDPEIKVNYNVSNINEDTLLKCKKMLKTLGLVYGAFDFLRTPEGDLVFLEVNPTGEWAWLEDQLGFPMRESFIKLLYGRGK